MRHSSFRGVVSVFAVLALTVGGVTVAVADTVDFKGDNDAGGESSAVVQDHFVNDALGSVDASQNSVVSTGKWGDADWRFDSGVLTVFGGTKANPKTLNASNYKGTNKPWLTGAGFEGDEVTRIVLVGPGGSELEFGGIQFPSNSAHLFSSVNASWWPVFLAPVTGKTLSNLVGITGLEKVDTSQVVSMRSMFDGAKVLTSKALVGLSKWDTSNVADMSSMFYDINQLTSLDFLFNWDTSNVTSMRYMFGGDTFNLRSVEGLSNWDTSKVTDMGSMFYGTYNLWCVDALSNWDTSRVKDMSGMFRGSSIESAQSLSGWNTKSVTDMSHMFRGAGYLGIIDRDGVNLSSWNTRNVENMESMFQNAFPWGVKMSVDLSGWNTNKLSNAKSMFQGATDMISLNLLGWNTRSPKSHSDRKAEFEAKNMFSGTPSLHELTLGIHTELFYDMKLADQYWSRSKAKNGVVTDYKMLGRTVRSFSARPTSLVQRHEFIDLIYLTKPLSGVWGKYTTPSEYPSSIHNCEGVYKVYRTGKLEAKLIYDPNGGKEGPYDETWLLDSKRVAGWVREQALPQSVSPYETRISGVVPKREGCKFQGWLYDGKIYQPGSKFNYKDSMLPPGPFPSVEEADKAGRLTFVAQWARLDSASLKDTVWEFDDESRVLTVFGGTSDAPSVLNVDSMPWFDGSVPAENIQRLVFSGSGGGELEPGGIVLPADSSYLFSSEEGVAETGEGTGLFEELVSIEGLDGFDVSNVKDMTGMFSGASSLTSLDLSQWDTSDVVSMENMFEGAQEIVTLELGSETVLQEDSGLVAGFWVTENNRFIGSDEELIGFTLDPKVNSCGVYVRQIGEEEALGLHASLDESETESDDIDDFSKLVTNLDDSDDESHVNVLVPQGSTGFVDAVNTVTVDNPVEDTSDQFDHRTGGLIPKRSAN